MLLLPNPIPRFYPILDTAALDDHGLSPVAAAEVLLTAGVGLLQFRHKSHYSRRIFDLAQQVATLCGAAKASLVINDRADIARLLGAGVHVGQEDLRPADARVVLSGRGLLGYSTHNAAQLQSVDCEAADYLAVGPVFSTSSKDNPDPVVGVEALPALRRLTIKPLVAIGGISLHNAASVFAAGIDCVAVIGGLLPPGASLRDLRHRAEQWLLATRDMV